MCSDFVAGSMTLATNSLTAGNHLTGTASPVIVQVPTVSAVHPVTLPAPNLPASAVTAVGAAVAKQELRQQQQQSQQVPPCPFSLLSSPVAFFLMSSCLFMEESLQYLIWLFSVNMHSSPVASQELRQQQQQSLQLTVRHFPPSISHLFPMDLEESLQHFTQHLVCLLCSGYA